MKLRISPALAKSGKTQTALADEIGVKKGFMSEIISGKKSPSLETLIALAAALNVPIGDLFEEPQQRPQARQGFGENDATPYDWKPNKDTSATAPQIIAAQIGMKHPATYQVTQSTPWLALLADDILLVDLGTKPQNGDTILIGLTDEQGFNTRTLLRRYQNGFALCPDPGIDQPAISLDSDPRAAWRGTIKGMIRLSA